MTSRQRRYIANMNFNVTLLGIVELFCNIMHHFKFQYTLTSRHVSLSFLENAETFTTP